VYYSAQIFLLGAEFTWIYAHEFGYRKGQDKPATAKEQGTATGKPAVEGGAATSQGRARDGNGSAPFPAAARVRTAPRRPRGATQRHAGVIAAAALLLGALASEALRYGQRRIRPRPMQALAGELHRLRALAPRRRAARLPKLFRA